MTYMPARQARKHLNHYHSATKRHLRKEKSESVRGSPRMHTILRHDGDDPLVISSLIGPTRNHHNMTEDKQQNQTGHDEADFPRGLTSAE
jgi:hypothetical protein